MAAAVFRPRNAQLNIIPVSGTKKRNLLTSRPLGVGWSFEAQSVEVSFTTSAPFLEVTVLRRIFLLVFAGAFLMGALSLPAAAQTHNGCLSQPVKRFFPDQIGLGYFFVENAEPWAYYVKAWSYICPPPKAADETCPHCPSAGHPISLTTGTTYIEQIPRVPVLRHMFSTRSAISLGLPVRSLILSCIRHANSMPKPVSITIARDIKTRMRGVF